VQLRQDRGPQGLDLTGVDFIDEVGLDLLQRWIDRGLQLRGGSAFIRKLLEARGLSPTAPPHHPDSRRTPS
jgi:anti-anti-sigma regulatory factor